MWSRQQVFVIHQGGSQCYGSKQRESEILRDQVQGVRRFSMQVTPCVSIAGRLRTCTCCVNSTSTSSVNTQQHARCTHKATCPAYSPTSIHQWPFTMNF